jgi:anti-sigma28 factor (negative regulator of flagellin synthesis)
MAINEISQFSSIHESDKLGKSQKVKKKESSPSEENKPSNSLSTDQVKISEKGLKLSDTEQLIANLQKDIAKIPDVNHEKIASIKSRISSNQYITDEILNQLAAKLSRSGLFGDIITNYAFANELFIEANQLPESSGKKLGFIQEKISTQFYLSKDVIQRVAEKLKSILK